MHDLLLVAGVCGVYVASQVYSNAIYKAHNTGGGDDDTEMRSKAASPNNVLAGLDWRHDLKRIETALQQSRTIISCLPGDRLRLCLDDGSHCDTHVRRGLLCFFKRRLVLVWHLTETLDARQDIRYSIVMFLLRLTPATNREGKPLDWEREWRDVLGTQVAHDARCTFNSLLVIRTTPTTAAMTAQEENNIKEPRENGLD